MSLLPPLSAVHSIIFTLQQTNQESLVHQTPYQTSRINYFNLSLIMSLSGNWNNLKKMGVTSKTGEDAALRLVLFPPLLPLNSHISIRDVKPHFEGWSLFQTA